MLLVRRDCKWSDCDTLCRLVMSEACGTAAGSIVFDDVRERAGAAVMHIGTGYRYVAKRRNTKGAPGVGIAQVARPVIEAGVAKHCACGRCVEIESAMA